MRQIFRYVAQLAVDRMISEMAVTRNEQSQLEQYKELRNHLARMFKRTLKALDANGAALVREASAARGNT